MIVRSYFLLIIVWLAACHSPGKGNSSNGKNIFHTFSEVVAHKGYDEAFESIGKELNNLKSVPDSFNSYLNYSYSFYDTARKHNYTEQAKAFLQNIIAWHDRLLTDSPSLLANAYYNWADIQTSKYGDSYNDSALQYFENVVSITQNKLFLSSRDLRYTNRRLGIYYNILGDLKKTLLFYDNETGLMDSTSSDKGRIGNAINRTIALRESGRLDESIETGEKGTTYRSVASSQAANMWTELSKSELEKGLFAEAGKSIDTALHILDTTTTTGTNRKEILNLKGAALLQKGNLLMLENKYPEALVSIRASTQNYQQGDAGKAVSRNLGKAYILFGNLFEKISEPDSALFYYQQALLKVIPSLPSDITAIPEKKAIYQENTIKEALDAKANLLQQLYSTRKNPELLKQAVNNYEMAFETERKLTQKFSYDESLMRQGKESKARSEKAIAACYELFHISKDESWANKALLMAEKSKSIVLEESIKRNLAVNQSATVDSNWLHVQLFQQEVNAYEKELVTLPASDTASIHYFNRLLSLAESKLLLANNTLLHSNSSYRENLLKTDSISLETIKANLTDEHTELLEFFTGDSCIYLFKVSRHSPTVFIKPDTSLDKSVNIFLSFFADKNKINNDPAAYQDAAYRLYLACGMASIKKGDIRQLIIIPDGKLNYIPFEALISSITTGQNPKQFSYLLSQYEISYGYSVATLLKQNESPPIAVSRVSFFAPVFANGERGNLPLLHSLEEGAAIKKETSSGEFYTGDNATVGQFKKSIPAAGIIHIATHANADTSGGVQPVINFYDSSLYLNDIYTLHIRPKLVVLSACETGIGIINKSEGAMSLARGFYYAGAKNIITSLWSVDDKSTADIFDRFYSYRGDNYSQSLCKAKREYLAGATNSTASPFYWAAFVHIGYQPAATGSNHTAWIISILAIALLLVFLYLKRK